jgi:catechol 2,3-dioxygenase-like lactoylglutathione lyase family enzyme
VPATAEGVELMVCSCCGEERDRLAALQGHGDVQVCHVCVEWLRSKLGVVDSTPILPVIDMDATVAFYETAGFEVRQYDGGYAFVSLDDESAFDLDKVDKPITAESNGAGCYLIVSDVDDWHRRLSSVELPVTSLADQPWGMREFALTDPNGNNIRIGHPRGN